MFSDVENMSFYVFVGAPAGPNPHRDPGGPRAPAGPHQGSGEGPGPRGGPRGGPRAQGRAQRRAQGRAQGPMRAYDMRL